MSWAPPISYAKFAGSACTFCGDFPAPVPALDDDPDEETQDASRSLEHCLHVQCGRCRRAWFCDDECLKKAESQHQRMCDRFARLDLSWSSRASPGGRGWAQAVSQASNLGHWSPDLTTAISSTRHCIVCNSTDTATLRACAKCHFDWRCVEHLPRCVSESDDLTVESIPPHFMGDCDAYLDFSNHCKLLKQLNASADTTCQPAFANEAEAAILSAVPDEPAEAVAPSGRSVSWTTWDDFFLWRFSRPLPHYEDDADSRATMVLATQQATQPLTTLKALRHFGLVLGSPQTFNIHVVGATPEFELFLGSADAILAHWDAIFATLAHSSLPNLVFVGPSVVDLGLDSRCRSSGRIHFHKQTYQEFVCRPDFQRPDLVMAFNPVMYRGGSWVGHDGVLETILKLNVPFCATARCESEAQQEDTLLDIVGAHVTLHPVWNEWHSLVPVPAFEHDELVAFQNHFTFCAQCERQTTGKSTRARRRNRKMVW